VSIRLEVIQSKERFNSLEKDWNELYNHCENVTIFSSWDWMFTWWEVFHTVLNTELLVLCVYKDETLIGIAPFQILNSFPKSIVQGRTITFIGSGENNKDKIVSQYVDLLVRPDKKEAVIDSISSYLVENKDIWDFADFEFLLENSVLSDVFINKDFGLQINLKQYGNRFYIPKEHEFDDFLEQMGNRWSKMFTKKHRKLDKDGKAKIESSNDFISAKIAFERLAKMHEVRWQGKTDFNIFNSSQFNEFHIKILQRLVPKNRAFIKTLFLDDMPLASYYYFKDNAQIHYYQSGFFSEQANKYSPLFLLVCREIETALKNKNTFDFMFAEDCSSYKKEQYAAKHKPMFRLMWSHKKTRMIQHDYAKKIQSRFLTIKKTFNKAKRN